MHPQSPLRTQSQTQSQSQSQPPSQPQLQRAGHVQITPSMFEHALSSVEGRRFPASKLKRVFRIVRRQFVELKVDTDTNKCAVAVFRSTDPNERCARKYIVCGAAGVEIRNADADDMHLKDQSLGMLVTGAGFRKDDGVTPAGSLVVYARNTRELAEIRQALSALIKGSDANGKSMFSRNADGHWTMRQDSLESGLNYDRVPGAGQSAGASSRVLDKSLLLAPREAVPDTMSPESAAAILRACAALVRCQSPPQGIFCTVLPEARIAAVVNHLTKVRDKAVSPFEADAQLLSVEPFLVGAALMQTLASLPAPLVHAQAFAAYTTRLDRLRGMGALAPVPQSPHLSSRNMREVGDASGGGTAGGSGVRVSRTVDNAAIALLGDLPKSAVRVLQEIMGVLSKFASGSSNPFSYAQAAEALGPLLIGGVMEVAKTQPGRPFPVLNSRTHPAVAEDVTILLTSLGGPLTARAFGKLLAGARLDWSSFSSRSSAALGASSIAAGAAAGVAAAEASEQPISATAHSEASPVGVQQQSMPAASVDSDASPVGAVAVSGASAVAVAEASAGPGAPSAASNSATVEHQVKENLPWIAAMPAEYERDDLGEHEAALQRLVDHFGFRLQEDPDSPDARYWRIEIAEAQREMREIRDIAQAQQQQSSPVRAGHAMGRSISDRAAQASHIWPIDLDDEIRRLRNVAAGTLSNGGDGLGEPTDADAEDDEPDSVVDKVLLLWSKSRMAEDEGLQLEDPPGAAGGKSMIQRQKSERARPSMRDPRAGLAESRQVLDNSLGNVHSLTESLGRDSESRDLDADHRRNTLALIGLLEENIRLRMKLNEASVNLIEISEKERVREEEEDRARSAKDAPYRGAWGFSLT